MNDSIKFNIIKISQPIGDLLITKISPQSLLQMSTVDRRRIERDEEILGIQRELKKNKVSQIKDYLKSVDATFPNSIIVNTKSKYIINENDNCIELKVNEETFTIIDGQHRLEGFRNSTNENFDLILTIFKDLKKSQQADVFSTINSQQTKVDPSLNLNLELHSAVMTPKRMMIEVAQSMNYDTKSPWYNNIQMLGSKKEGIISLSAFVKPLLSMTYRESDYYLIRNELQKKEGNPDFTKFKYDVNKFLFWELYKNEDFNSVYKILYNFFSSIKTILCKDWLNKESLLNKTTGYNAIMKLFKDIVVEGLQEGKLTYEFFYDKLSPLKEFENKINSNNYGASGAKASVELYNEFKKVL